MAFHFLNNLSTQGVRYPSSMAEQYLYPFKSAVYWIPHSNRAAWKLPIGPGMEIWRGLQSTVTFGHNRKLMLNADVAQKAFYIMDFPIIDFYLAVLNEGSRSQRIMYRKDMSRETCMDMRQRDQLSKALKGLKLKLVYASSYTRFVDVFKPANVVRFRLKRNDESESVPLTVEEYFYRYRGIRLNFPNLPVIQCGSRSKQIYIPMELLNVSDRVQRVKRNLNPFQLQKASRGCVLNPHDRFRLIYQMLCESFSDIGEGDSMLRNFGVTISDNFVHATGRLLPSPQLLMHDKTVKVSSGKWRLSDSRLKDAPSMVLFGAVCVSNSVTIQQFRIPFDNLVEGCRIFGIHFVSNYVSRDFPLYEWQIRGDDTEDINSLRGTIRKFRNEIDQFGNVHINPLLFFIVADVDTFCYSTIKIVCDVEEGIASQVLLKKTLLRMDKPPKINPTIHNVVLKLNTKLGGVNNAVVPNYLEWKMFVNEHDATLFIGIDTTHPSSGDTSSVSVAAIVGSTNIEATRYGASIKIQEMNQERGVYLKDVVSERIIAFFEATCKKPQHIVVFRDGVSNSEFEQIANEEMMGIKASIRGLASQDCNFDPTVSYVVIQKRHQTRFFVENKDVASENGNVPPGTVVDETITSPDLFDFYLCSHFGQIGTSRPAHYTVLYDSWHLSSDQWQQMAYALCHVYARCNRSVSIPAPVYYAHLACVRARCHLRMGSRSSETLPLHEERTEQYRLILDEKVRVKPAVQEMYFI
ncbi:hypothetical protein AB6A40_003389 [Gnathostoma spinigerum]|uniref:Uncharacterized protein n=1 Tax=Gnathostoma spinigerum TaxID=75299 RepID=A0ABD6EK87_9BILA